MSTRTETPTARPAVDGVKGARILIVESRYYPEIADALISGAEREIDRNGAVCERVVVPGAFEIPGAIAEYLARENLPARLRLSTEADITGLPWSMRPLLEITKGATDEQQRKIDASALAQHFERVHIVAEKDVDTYRDLARHHDHEYRHERDVRESSRQRA